MDQRQALATLTDVIGAKNTGSPALVVVEAAAGGGKTHLIRKFLAHYENLKCWQLSGASSEQQLPGSTLAKLLPNTAAADLGEALISVLHGDAEQPAVLVVENLHWVDQASLQALHYAWRRLSHQNITMILTVRGPSGAVLTETAQELIDRPEATRIELSTPGGQALSDIAAKRANVEISPAAAIQLAHYVKGDVRTFIDLVTENPGERWERFRRWIPSTRAVTEDVKSRLSALPEPVAELIYAAALLGKASSLTLVLELLNKPVDLSLVDQLENSGIVSVRGGGLDVHLHFRSVLERMAVYGLISVTRRLQLHLRAAEILTDPVKSLFHRVDGTLVPDQELLTELIDQAGILAGRGQWSGAAALLFQASLIPESPQQRDEVFLEAVDATVAAGNIPQAQGFEHRLASMPPSAQRDVVTGYLAIVQGRAQVAERALGYAWRQALRRQNTEAMAKISQRQVLHSLSLMNGRRLVDWAEQSLELADLDSPLAVEATVIQGLGLAMLGRRDEGEQILLSILDKLPASAQRQRAEMSLGWVYLAEGHIELARHQLMLASSTVYNEGSLRIALWAKAWLARAEYFSGDWEQALHTVRAAADMQESSGIELLRPLIHLTAVQIHVVRGNTALVEEHLRKAWCPTGSYPVMEIPYRIARAYAAKADANYAEVLMALSPILDMDRAHGIDTPGFWIWHDMYAEALVRCDRVGEAEEFLAPLLAAAKDAEHRGITARYLCVYGLIHADRGDIDAARDAFEEASAQLAETGSPFARATVDLAYGQMLRRAGKRADCVAPLTRALATFTQVDAKVYVDLCRRELKASGTTGGRRDPQDFSSLTNQEQAVARLVSAGESNRRVAQELFIGEKTVQYHLTKIYAKLGISSRTELAARSAR